MGSFAPMLCLLTACPLAGTRAFLHVGILLLPGISTTINEGENVSFEANCRCATVLARNLENRTLRKYTRPDRAPDLRKTPHLLRATAGDTRCPVQLYPLLALFGSNLPDSAQTVLRAEEYDGDDDGSWVMLEAVGVEAVGPVASPSDGPGA